MIFFSFLYKNALFCLKEAEHRFDVYTYNRSEIVMVDEDQNEMYNDDIDTSYNWDTREDKWISGKSSYESVEFSCRAYGGRPVPTFR